MFLKYLDSSEYGIWLAIFSTVTWINFFDLGVGNGLRNRLTMCFAKNNIIQAKKFIGSALAFFFCDFNHFISNIFNCIIVY